MKDGLRLSVPVYITTQLYQYLAHADPIDFDGGNIPQDIVVQIIKEYPNVAHLDEGSVKEFLSTVFALVGAITAGF